MAMIIRFQLGNLCMRNKGTLFSAHNFPRITRLQLCVIFSPVLSVGEPGTDRPSNSAISPT